MKNKLIIIIIVVAVVIIIGSVMIFLFNSKRPQAYFMINDTGTIIAPDSTEYIHLGNEGNIVTFGNCTFVGKIEGEKKLFVNLNYRIETGMYSCEGYPDYEILIRIIPDSQWVAYYRKASLPELDLSPDNCIRFEFIKWEDTHYGDSYTPDIAHMSCNEGISDNEGIKAFLEDVRSQKSPMEAGLYDLVRNTDGMLQNCYNYGIVYGYFKDEPNLAIPFYVTSYNDKAYSISIEGQEYVLPEEWLTALDMGTENLSE